MFQTFQGKSCWIAAVLVVLAVGGAALVWRLAERPAVERPRVALFSGKEFRPHEKIPIEMAFASAGLRDYSFEHGAVHVPADQRERYILALKDVPALRGLEDAGARAGSGSLWQSEQQRTEEARREKQEKIALAIRNMNGMEGVQVLLDEMEQKTGFQREKHVSASISIQTLPDFTPELADIAAIRDLVQGAVCGLKPENITIIDSRRNRSWRGDALGSNPAVASAQKMTFITQESDAHEHFAKADDVARKMLTPGGQAPPLEANAPVDVPRIATAEEVEVVEIPEVVEVVPPGDTEDAEVVTPTKVELLTATTLIWLGAGGAGVLILALVVVWVVSRQRRRAAPEPSQSHPQPQARSAEPPAPLEPAASPAPPFAPSLTAPPPAPVPPTALPVAPAPATVLARVAKLCEYPDAELSRALREERTPAIALALLHFPEARRDAVLATFPDSTRAAVTARLAKSRGAEEEILCEALHAVLENLSALAARTELAGDVAKKVSETQPDTEPDTEPAPPEERILAVPETRVNEQIFGRFDDAELLPPASRRGSCVTKFEDLAGLPESDLRRVLSRCDPKTAVMALVGAPPELLEKVFRTLSKTEAVNVRYALEHPGALRLSEIEHAQGRVLDMAIRAGV